MGLLGVVFLAKVPEPPITKVNNMGLHILLSDMKKPLRDPNFRRLITFSVIWTFTMSFAGPFLSCIC
jgi:hypothetical protein